MTRCYFYIKNTSNNYAVKVVGTRGSDWGSIENDYRGPNENNFTLVQSMGCPRAGTETDHWGWLYLKAFPKDVPDFAKYFCVFVRLRHSGDCEEMGMDWIAMTLDNEQPDNLPPRDMPSDGREDAVKKCPPLGKLSWYPDKSDQDWRLRNGEKGCPVVEITFSM